jgi:hypothetical protein
MQIKPQFGIDQLLFGMKQQHVKAIYGQPDKQFRDEEKNEIYVYNKPQLRLTFYEEEDFRLGYIISSCPDLTIFNNKVIGKTVAEVQNELKKHQFNLWELEEFDLTENHFNENNWLILQSEFGRITKVEIGAIIKNEDDFDWKFNA